MEFSSFPPPQRTYLDILTKFSGRTNRLKLLDYRDMSKRKEIFITENLTYLTNSEQAGFNDCKIAMKDALAYCRGVFVGGFLFLSIFYVIRTPATRSLWHGILKSACFGGVASLGFYQYNAWEYQEKLKKYYIKVLNKKRSLK